MEYNNLDPYLDYSFGWRYLLPCCLNETVKILGFSDRNVNWLLKKIRCKVHKNNQLYDGLIVNLEKINNISIVESSIKATNKWFVLIGSGKKITNLIQYFKKDFYSFEYALIPPSYPRLVIPLTNFSITRTALRLHRPGRLFARIVLSIASVLLQFKINVLLKKKILVIGLRHPTSFLEGSANNELIKKYVTLGYSALYLGNPERDRKTIILPLKDFPPKKIIKLAENPLAEKVLENEKNTLKFLERSDLKKQVPIILDWESYEGTSILCLEYRERKWAHKRIIDSAAKEFLCKLAIIEIQYTTFKNMILNLKRQEDDYGPYIYLLNNILSTLNTKLTIQNNLRILLSRNHGDFTPWNCSWTKNGFFVFDWEKSKTREIVLGDAFYYHIAPYIYIYNNKKPDKYIKKALDFANKVAVKIGIEPNDVPLYFILWCIQNLNKSSLYDKILQRYIAHFI